MKQDDFFELEVEYEDDDDQKSGGVPEEILDLARFLAAVIANANQVRLKVLAEPDPQKALEILRIHFPIIQGLKNQEAINKIAAQQIDSKNISKAVEWMLE